MRQLLLFNTVSDPSLPFGKFNMMFSMSGLDGVYSFGVKKEEPPQHKPRWLNAFSKLVKSDTNMSQRDKITNARTRFKVHLT